MTAPAGHVVKDASWDEGGWTQVPNDIVRDRALSLDAKGLILVIASHSTSYKIHLEALRLQVGVGKEKLQKLLKELEGAGYLKREATYQRIDGRNRRGPNNYILYRARTPIPQQLVFQTPENQSHELTSENTAPEVQQPGFQTPEPQTPEDTTSIKKTNSKKTKTDGGAAEAAPRSRPHRLPEDFKVTDDMRAWFKEHCPNLVGQGLRQTEMFKEHWAGEGGPRAVKSNWAAAWRTWMLKADGWAKPQGPKYGSRVYTSSNGAQIER